MKKWEGFKQGSWTELVNVRDFIVEKNFEEYKGDGSFLVGPTDASTKLKRSANRSFKTRKRKWWRPRL